MLEGAQGKPTAAGRGCIYTAQRRLTETPHHELNMERTERRKGTHAASHTLEPEIQPHKASSNHTNPESNHRGAERQLEGLNGLERGYTKLASVSK
eukprot:1878114-Rhodomonas_salina.4